MTKDRDDSTGINREAPPRYDNGPLEQQPQQPAFGGFSDEEEDYEEPDRDTDYASGFRELSIEEDEFEDVVEEASYEGEEETEDQDEDSLSFEYEEDPPYEAPAADRYREPVTDSNTTAAADSRVEPTAGLDETYAADYEDDAPAFYDSTDTKPDLFASTVQPEQRWQEPAMDDTDQAEEWLDDENYPAEEGLLVAQPWPLGLIAVALVALLLLGAGGYGVIQQRSATQEEIRQLRAALATAASPQEAVETRTALQEEQQQSLRLAAQIDSLQLENRRLTDTVNGLAAQLEAQQAALLASEAAKVTPKAAAPAAKPTPKPVPAASTSSAASTSGGNWFVNFGSYGQREIAQQWVGKLKPADGKVITAPGTRDGRTFYRVRVIGLPSREGAEKIARTLEREYGLPKLWIGKQD